MYIVQYTLYIHVCIHAHTHAHDVHTHMFIMSIRINNYYAMLVKGANISHVDNCTFCVIIFKILHNIKLIKTIHDTPASFRYKSRIY